MFGIPVGVHFTFVFIAFIVGGRGDLTGLGVATEIAAILGSIFVAVLLHEAGHAFTARRYGAQNVGITLFALGGVTTYTTNPPLSPGKRFVITAAGSAAGIAAGGTLALLWWGGLFDNASVLTRLIAGVFIWASLGWGVLNWMPLRPLDGGQMLTAVLEIVAPRRGEAIARVVTIVVGAAAIVIALRFDQPFMAVFVAVLVLLGLRSPASARPAPAPAPADDPALEDRAKEAPPEFPI